MLKIKRNYEKNEKGINMKKKMKHLRREERIYKINFKKNKKRKKNGN